MPTLHTPPTTSSLTMPTLHTPPFIDRARRWAALLLASASLGLAGCAALPDGHAAHPQDPWERYNRSMQTFNDNVDAAVLKPVATAYQTVTPQPARTGITNFFSNIGDLWSMANHLLQGQGEKAYNHLVRFTTNTVFGLGGLIDIATEAQIPREKQDFGHTLARWGVQPGPYVVLPLLGPSTLRETVALPVDVNGYALNRLYPVSHRNSLTALRLTDQRANLLQAGDTLDAIALDRYSLVRDFYLSQRERQHQDDNAGKIEDFDD